MSRLVRAIDVSNYQPTDLSELIAQTGAEHVVVRLSLPGERIRPEIALAQIASAKANGCTVGGYVWAYADVDPAQTVRDALALAETAGVKLPVLWIDCEEDPGPDALWLRVAVAECRRLGVQPGIYTGSWWWDRRFGGDVEFAGLPFWLAIYDGVANLPDGLAGKQYAADGVDRDVFRNEYTGG